MMVKVGGFLNIWSPLDETKNRETLSCCLQKIPDLPSVAECSQTLFLVCRALTRFAETLC